MFPLWYLFLLPFIDVVCFNHSLQSTKQLKLVPFPNIELDTDVAMSEAEPLYPNIHHSRLQSSASSISSSASDSPISGTRMHISYSRNTTIHICAMAAYPSFDVYPLPFFHNNSVVSNCDSSALPPNSLVGLIQPSSPFIHHGYAAKSLLASTFYLIKRLFFFSFFFFCCMAIQGKLYANSETSSRLCLQCQWSTHDVESLRTMRRNFYGRL